MLQCLCGLQYVGRITRALHVRLEEHLGSIKQRSQCLKTLHTKPQQVPCSWLLKNIIQIGGEPMQNGIFSAQRQSEFIS